MTISITLDKTGFDNTSDPVNNTGLLGFAGSVENKFNDFANGIQASDQHLFSSAETLNITAGIIDAPTKKLVIVSTEGGAPEDYLDTIGVSNGRGIVVRAAPGETVTLRHAFGNITTLDGTNVVLTGNKAVEIWCWGSQWSVVSPGSSSAIVPNNYIDATDPTQDDDANDGWQNGSLWFNWGDQRAFILVRSNVGVAQWKQITPHRNKWEIRGAGVAIKGVGVADPTVLNTPTSGNDATDSFTNLVSTAVAGQLAGFITTTFNLTRPAHDPTVEILVKTGSDLTNLRHWIGYIDAALTNVDVLAAGRKFIGWRLSSFIPDGGWRPVLHDGTTQNVGTAMGGTVTANTTYKLKFRIDSLNSSVYFSVNDGDEQMLNGNFPAAATDLGFVCRLIPITAVIRSIGYGYTKVTWE